MPAGPSFDARPPCLDAAAGACYQRLGNRPVRPQPCEPRAVHAIKEHGYLRIAKVQGGLVRVVLEPLGPAEAFGKHGGIVAVPLLHVKTDDGMLHTMTPDQTARLAALNAFLVRYERKGKTRNQFWSEFWAVAGDLDIAVRKPDADAELAERYFDIVDNAHEGYGGEGAIMDEVME